MQLDLAMMLSKHGCSRLAKANGNYFKGEGL